jgi:hypothetical protein
VTYANFTGSCSSYKSSHNYKYQKDVKLWLKKMLLLFQTLRVHLCISDSSVGLSMDYVLEGRGVRVLFPTGIRDISHLRSIQTGSEAHPASYTMGTGGSFLGGKAAGA